MALDTSHHPKRKRKRNRILFLRLSRDTIAKDLDTIHHKRKRNRKRENRTKLVDAYAAGRCSKKCTLILTGGGDSVRAFAIAGIRNVVGQRHYGVFPLPKLLNVREATHKQIMEDDEIQHIKKIIGLQDGKVYDSVNSLRYGQLIIMTNQDREGSLIKGLFINFIRFFWPSLLKIPSFLVDVYTPPPTTVKELGSFTKEEGKRWLKNLERQYFPHNFPRELKILTKGEANWWFKNLQTHLRYFTWVDEADGDAIDMAFSKKIEERKTWMMNETWVDHEEKHIRYSDFVNKELMHYLADIQRYIPSMVDGLNEVQRTILCCAFKHDLVTEISFPELLRLLNHSAYHYDVDSLAGAIIGMANDILGSNNLNLFSLGAGMFGTRLEGVKFYVDTRYLSTNLTPIARFLFPKEDDILLNYMKKDGQPIQPTWHAPVIPLVLVNGCREFGIGWSTFVPSYCPIKLCGNVRRLLNGEPPLHIDPWYKGFQGTIKKNGASYTTSGEIQCIDDTTLQITELPVHTWTEHYQEFLDTLSKSTGETEEPFIENYVEHNTGFTVHFEINISRENMKLAKEEGLENKFKLTTAISTDNMHLCDPHGAITKYDNPEEILEDFFHLRLNLYSQRRTMMLQYLELELFKLQFQRDSILGARNGDLTCKTEENVLAVLKENNLFTLFQNTSQATRDIELLEFDKERFSSFYKDLYLLNIRVVSEKFFMLEKEKLCNQINELKKSTPEDLWRNDLNVLERKLEELEKKLKKAEDDRKILERMSKEKVKLMREACMADEEATPVGSLMDMDNVSKTVKPPPKGVGGGRKAPAEKQQNPTIVDSNEDGEILAGKVTSRTLHQAKGLQRRINPQQDDHSNEEFGVGVELPQPERKDVE